MTLSDEEAKKRGTQKTVLERKAPPTFEVIIEIMEVDKLAIHHDVTQTVDRMLRGGQPRPEIRIRNEIGEVEIIQRAEIDARASRSTSLDRGSYSSRTEATTSHSRSESNGVASPVVEEKTTAQIVRIFAYGVSRSRLERAIRTLRVPAFIVKDASDADALITLKASYRKEPARLQEGIERRLPTYVIKSNTYVQIESVLREIFQLSLPMSEEDSAIQEAEEAIEEILNSEPGDLNSTELAPQNAYIRRLQHQVAEKYRMVSDSVGIEPTRRVRISRP